MKVCHITTVHQQDDSRIFHKQCRSIAKAGHDITLLVINGKTETIDGVKIVGVPFVAKGRIDRILNAGKEILNRALEINADIYQLHDPELLRIAKKLKNKSGAKVVYDSHEDLPKQVLDKHWIPKIARKFISKLVRNQEMKVAKKIDGVISVTEKICARFATINNNVALVANYPILTEMDKHRTNIGKEDGVVCYIGGLTPTRGIKELVQSLPFSKGKLLLAGKFSTEEFETEVKSLEGWKKVEYLGLVDRAKIVEVLQKSHAGIVTLHPTKSYKEALPIKLFEYMSAGIPSIASNFKMWSTIVEGNECGVMADPLKPKEIAEKIDFLLDNPSLAEQMGKNGRAAVVEKYSWETQAKSLLNLYDQITKVN